MNDMRVFIFLRRGAAHRVRTDEEWRIAECLCYAWCITGLDAPAPRQGMDT